MNGWNSCCHTHRARRLVQASSWTYRVTFCFRGAWLLFLWPFLKSVQSTLTNSSPRTSTFVPNQSLCRFHCLEHESLFLLEQVPTIAFNTPHLAPDCTDISCRSFLFQVCHKECPSNQYLPKEFVVEICSLNCLAFSHLQDAILFAVSIQTGFEGSLYHFRETRESLWSKIRNQICYWMSMLFMWIFFHIFKRWISGKEIENADTNESAAECICIFTDLVTTHGLSSRTFYIYVQYVKMDVLAMNHGIKLHNQNSLENSTCTVACLTVLGRNSLPRGPCQTVKADTFVMLVHAFVDFDKRKPLLNIPY